jgi:hypothetical protein
MANLFDNLFSNIKDTKEDEKNESKISTHEQKASKYDRQKSEMHSIANAKAMQMHAATGTGCAGGAHPSMVPPAGLRGRTASSGSQGSGRRDSSSGQSKRRDVSSKDLYPQNVDFVFENVNKEGGEMVDHDFLDIDTLKKFTIPKRQKAKKGK